MTKPDWLEVFLGAIVFASLICASYFAVALAAVLMGVEP